MSRQYDTFISRYQPVEHREKFCCSKSPALIARFILRTAVPILLGVGAGMLTEWTGRYFNLNNTDTLVEISDFTSCAMTLITAYTINALLDRCWPINPYSSSNFFQQKLPENHPININSNIGLNHA